MINSLFFLGVFFLFLPESLCFCLLDHKQTTSNRRTLVLLKNFQDLFLYFQWKLEFFVYMIDWAYFLPELTFFLRRSCNFRVMWGRLNCRKDEWTVVRRNSLLLSAFMEFPTNQWVKMFRDIRDERYSDEALIQDEEDPKSLAPPPPYTGAIGLIS